MVKYTGPLSTWEKKEHGSCGPGHHILYRTRTAVRCKLCYKIETILSEHLSLKHCHDCPNTTLTARVKMDTEVTSSFGAQLFHVWEECFSCGARNPTRLVAEYTDEKKAS